MICSYRRCSDPFVHALCSNRIHWNGCPMNANTAARNGNCLFRPCLPFLFQFHSGKSCKPSVILMSCLLIDCTMVKIIIRWINGYSLATICGHCWCGSSCRPSSLLFNSGTFPVSCGWSLERSWQAQFMIMFSSWHPSARSKSLAEIAKAEIGQLSGVTAFYRHPIILIVCNGGSDGGCKLVIRKRGGTFTIAAQFRSACSWVFGCFVYGRCKVAEATLAGIVLLTLAVIYGRTIPDSPLLPGSCLTIALSPFY